MERMEWNEATVVHEEMVREKEACDKRWKESIKRECEEEEEEKKTMPHKRSNSSMDITQKHNEIYI